MQQHKAIYFGFLTFLYIQIYALYDTVPYEPHKIRVLMLWD